jgi:hypothetical protein
MELRDYVALFLRRKWLIVFSFLFILLGASVYCVVVPEQYKSSTTILIIPQSVPQDYVRSTISVRVEEQLATIKQQVLSRTTLLWWWREDGGTAATLSLYPSCTRIGNQRCSRRPGWLRFSSTRT